MNCEQVVPLLSAFYDDEMSSDQRAPVADHVSSCPDCSRRLDSLKGLSALVQRSPIPATPRSLPGKVESAIAQSEKTESLVSRPSSPYRSRIVFALAVTAAAFMGIIFWQAGWYPRAHHQEMAATFGRFLDAYAASKDEAPQILVSRFQGKSINVQFASQVLKHESVARPTLLAKNEVASRYMLQMPDCDCVATVYSCEGKTSLVLLEHDKEHTEWFGTRPMDRTQCAGKSCCLVTLDGSMVATWKVKDGYVTAVGVHDMVQLEQLMGELVSS